MQHRTNAVSAPIATSTWRRKGDAEEGYSFIGERNKWSWRRPAERNDIVLAILSLLLNGRP
jgi:hypothetical protein